MMPQPRGNDSAWRAGNGFQISNNRKSIKPTSKYFQLRGEDKEINPIEALTSWMEAAFHQSGTPQPISSVKCWPETSSMTTRCGSLIFQNFAARLALQTPLIAIMMVRIIWKVKTASKWKKIESGWWLAAQQISL